MEPALFTDRPLSVRCRYVAMATRGDIEPDLEFGLDDARGEVGKELFEEGRSGVVSLVVSQPLESRSKKSGTLMMHGVTFETDAAPQLSNDSMDDLRMPRASAPPPSVMDGAAGVVSVSACIYSVDFAIF